ncbi:hypothetical protein WJX84_007141 [Apatococcus fuscideae]|uniref:TATA-binding protein interacting (TIP20) domain-containing protein n=1 Tax=Apatococcus fuscideae TaxID=2026836 RepID=A0AAW1SZ44_9CHLO
MSSAQALNLILDKIASKDKDFRWMATSDLHNELQKPGFKTDAEMERRLCSAVLMQLDDASGEISGLAVKCLGALANNVGEDKVKMLLSSLCDKLISGKKDSQRETASLGLKSVIGDLSVSNLASFTFTVPSLVLLKLKQGLQAKESQEVISECLDIMAEVLLRFGRSLKDEHLFLKDILLQYLADSRSVIRKKAVSCIATLSPYVPDEQLDNILGFLLDNLNNKSTKPELRQAFVHTLGLISPGTDDMEEDDEDQADDEDEMSDEGYSDDDDASWKVRRASSKCLSAIINSYPDLIDEVYPELSPPLLARFREREENVKMDIFNTYTDLLRQVANTSGSFEGSTSSSPVGMLRSDSQNISKAAARQLKEKSLKARSGILGLLKEFAAILPDQIPASLSQLIPGIQQALLDNSAVNSGLKIQALLFLRTAMARSAAEPWQSYLSQLSSALFKAVGERYYKIAAEALRACEQLIRIIRPDLSQPIAQQHLGPVQPLFQCVMQRLSGQDQDQEVKECAISCMASIIACLGDVLLPEVPQALRVLLDRLRNDITRLTAVKAITTVAHSPLPVDLNLVIEPVLTELTSFMRKANRPLKQASLSAMEALVARHGARKEQAAVQAMEAVSPIISETDLVLTALALRFCTTLLRQQRTLGPHVTQRILPQALALIKSPMLQGTALEAMQAFFAALVSLGVKEASAPKLIEAIVGSAKAESHAAKQAAAQCIAALAIAEGAAQVSVTVKIMLDILQGQRGDAGSRYLALLALGEVGRTTDLSGYDGVSQAVTGALEGSSLDELRTAASSALGGLAVGSTSAFLPFILQQIQAQAGKPKEQYLLLRSLNEVIVSFETSAQQQQHISDGQQDQIMQLLLANCIY